MAAKLNLAEMAQGAFMEQFHLELAKVLTNIKDPNTDAKAARKITLTVTLKADDDREVVTFAVQTKAALAPAGAGGLPITPTPLLSAIFGSATSGS